MNQIDKLTILLFAFIFISCQGKIDKKESGNHADTSSNSIESESSEYPLTGIQAENDSLLLRLAFIGDAEPKPLAEFPNMEAAVEQINILNQSHPIDFAIGIGDIAHKGTIIQYEAATKVLQKLNLPFYPIMGNEEHGSTVERFMEYARQWNSRLISQNYVLDYDQLAFIFASPDYGRDFEDSTVSWILTQMQLLAPKPIILIVHGAQKGVYQESPDKGIGNLEFRQKVISQSNLAVVVSGDLHMDMDRVIHSKIINKVHYLHIPALERTKVPDETNHTPMFRIMSINKDGRVRIDTYALGDSISRKEHEYSFKLNFPE